MGKILVMMMAAFAAIFCALASEDFWSTGENTFAFFFAACAALAALVVIAMGIWAFRKE